MMIKELRCPLEMDTPKGRGFALFLYDYGLESDIYWLVVLNETRKYWMFSNKDVTATGNITIGRQPFSAEINVGIARA